MLEALICPTGARFHVRIPFHEAIVTKFKEFSGYVYDHDENCHNFSSEDGEKIIDLLLGLNVNVTQVTAIPKPKKIDAVYTADNERILIWIPFSDSLRQSMRKLNAQFDSETCYYNLPIVKQGQLLDEFRENKHPIVEGELPTPKPRKIEVRIDTLIQKISN